MTSYQGDVLCPWCGSDEVDEIPFDATKPEEYPHGLILIDPRPSIEPTCYCTECDNFWIKGFEWKHASDELNSGLLKRAGYVLREVIHHDEAGIPFDSEMLVVYPDASYYGHEEGANGSIEEQWQKAWEHFTNERRKRKSGQ